MAKPKFEPIDFNLKKYNTMEATIKMGTDNDIVRAYNNYAPRWAERQRSGKNWYHEYLEKPQMYSSLPSLQGKCILCLGCGSGEECMALIDGGADADKVIGVDIASELVKEARDAFPKIDFQVMDMEELAFGNNTFDIVYSSLSIHYVENWGKTLASVYRVLKPGGTFVFSTHHPLRWGAEIDRRNSSESYLMGYCVQNLNNGRSSGVYGDYFTARKIKDTWFNDFYITFYHKPLSTIMNEIIASGFMIREFHEPKATPEGKEHNLELWTVHQKIPMFMIFVLGK